jgi:adenylyltransferase/sulfurtransferase
MSVKINIPWLMQDATNGVEIAKVTGNNVSECLQYLAEQFPAIKKQLFDEEGKLSPFVDIHVNGMSAYPDGLAKPVKYGDELAILLVIGGG